MPHLTTETKSALGKMLALVARIEAEIFATRSAIAQMETIYARVCKGFLIGQEPEKPFELLQAYLDIESATKALKTLEGEINKVEDTAMAAMQVNVVSRSKKGVMVVLAGKDPATNKKVTLTRHLRLEKDGKYSGKSLLGHRIVSYLVDDYVSKAA